MDANTAIVLAGLVIVGLAWIGLVLGTLAALVRDALDVGGRPRGPVAPPRRRRRPPSRLATRRIGRYPGRHSKGSSPDG